MTDQPENNNAVDDIKDTVNETVEDVRETVRQEAETARTFTEEIEVAGNQVVERVRELIEEGNVRQLRIKSAEDQVYLEIPLTIGAIVGGALAFSAPWLAVLGAFAALVARVKIEVVREIKPDKDKNDD